MRTINYAQDERSFLPGRGMAPLQLENAQITSAAVDSLNDMGICIDQHTVHDMVTAYRSGKWELGSGMDSALTAPLTTASVTTPIQFLQAWLPGFVNIITAVRRIDDLVGIVTQGSWEDEEVVQGVMERTGNTSVYTDSGNVPQSSWNVNYERRTIVRFEEGMTVGRLQEARAARIRVNTAEAKRGAAAEALEITRNRVGFNGLNAGANRTFGYLNDPELPAYVTVAVGASAATEWSTKTFLEIVADLREAIQSLRTSSQERVDPMRTEIALALATSSIDFMTTVSDFGISVMGWLQSTYPMIRVISAPELDAANAGDNVFYLYAETVSDSGTDDNRTFIQVVPQKFRTLGVEQRAKEYTEAYSNATAGVLLKRPYAVIRRSGI